MGTSRASERRERLAKALRANLKRRKVKPRPTADADDTPQPETPVEDFPRDALSRRNSPR
ncbi:MAG TPA: hypothetical protein VIY09_04825 [Rhizomicrobium sp.]